MTFEDLVKKLNLEGWLVINLSQMANNYWRCNLQKKTPNGSTLALYTEYAEGKTALEALTGAVKNAGQPRNSPPKKAKPVIRKGLAEISLPDRERLGTALERLTAAIQSEG